MTLYPVTEVNLGDSFGRRFIQNSWQMHAGQDFKGLDEGSKIFVVLDGVVRFAGWNDTYGYCVIVTHPNGYETLYAHMYKFPSVVAMQRVYAGQSIGGVGNTGFSFGNHLHFAVFKGKFNFGNISNAVEPLTWLKEYTEDDMAISDDDINRLLRAFDNAGRWDFRQNAFGGGAENGPTIWNQLGKIINLVAETKDAVAKITINPDVDIDALTDSLIKQGIKVVVIDK